MMQALQKQPMIEPTDREAFALLVREHHRELLTYAMALTKESHTSRDLVQDAFVVAWSNLSTFDVTRDFGAWMRGIVRNKWRESIRKNQRQISLDEEMLECLEAEAREWDEFREHGGVFSKLENCLKKLPETLSDAVTAFYYQDKSGDESAAVLGIESNTLRKRLQRARAGLRECLQS